MQIFTATIIITFLIMYEWDDNQLPMYIPPMCMQVFSATIIIIYLCFLLINIVVFISHMIANDTLFMIFFSFTG